MALYESEDLSGLLARAIRSSANDDLKELAWTAHALRAYGSASVKETIRLLKRGTAAEKAAAAEILPILANKTTSAIHDRCFKALRSALRAEQADDSEPRTIAAIAHALGHMHDGRSVPLLVKLTDNPDPDVRYAVASSLPGACDWDPQPELIDALILLTNDTDHHVRDWACFGLGQLKADGEIVRNALAARLDDEDHDTRCEALVALASTGDARATDYLIHRLNGRNIFNLEVEAAARLAEPLLHPLLLSYSNCWVDDNWDVISLDFALSRCDPNAKRVATQHDLALFKQIEAALPDHDIKLEGAYPRSRLIVSRKGSIVHAEQPWEYAEPFTFDVALAAAAIVSRVIAE